MSAPNRSVDLPVDPAFTRALPKAELHAHLSGSVSKATLHQIWTRKRASGRCTELEDPLVALGATPDISTFFGVFNDYIYKLLDDTDTVQEATRAVVDDFAADGVAYLELRTTPRAIPSTGVTRQAYVRAVMEALRSRHADGDGGIEAHLLLSVDRTMAPADADEVVALARQYSRGSEWEQQSPAPAPLVLGVDLCGDPQRGDVSALTGAFADAKRAGLRIAVHFAETPASSSAGELRTLLSWRPDRLGHAIHVPEEVKRTIRARRLALELCLSCNVLAGMVPGGGGFAEHHFGEWRRGADNAVALATDDVGVFGSPLSNEYLRAAEHFRLARGDLMALSRSAVDAAFGGQNRMHTLLDEFGRGGL